MEDLLAKLPPRKQEKSSAVGDFSYITIDGVRVAFQQSRILVGAALFFLYL